MGFRTSQRGGQSLGKSKGIEWRKEEYKENGYWKRQNEKEVERERKSEWKIYPSREAT
jgi:hypothetical protein